MGLKLFKILLMLILIMYVLFIPPKPTAVTYIKQALHLICNGTKRI